MLAEKDDLRNYVSLLSGLLGIVATTITALRNATKFDVKAEMFRSAAGQYRLMATRLEERIRTHRMAMIDDSWKDPEVRKNEVAIFKKFFSDNYRIIMTAQSEMKYFPPGAALRMWKKAKALLPSEVDQPEVDRANLNALLEEFL